MKDDIKEDLQIVSNVGSKFIFILKEVVQWYLDKYQKNLKKINNHWLDANSEQKYLKPSNFYDEKECKILKDYVFSIEIEIRQSGSEHHRNFRARIEAARNTLIRFSKERVTNTFFFKSFKGIDAIAAAINFIIDQLKDCSEYDASNYCLQKSYLTVIKEFLRKVLTDEGIHVTSKDKRIHKESVSTIFTRNINDALASLELMNKNKSFSDKAQEIASRSDKIIRNGLRLVIGILQPMPTLISGYPHDYITLMDIENLQEGIIVSTVGGEKGIALSDNPFIDEIKAIAKLFNQESSSIITYLDHEKLMKKITLSNIKKLKNLYKTKKFITPIFAPFVLFKKTLHSNQSSIYTLTDVHKLKKEYNELQLFSKKESLPKKLKPNTIYLVKTNLQKTTNNRTEMTLYYGTESVKKEHKININSDEWKKVRSLPFPEEEDKKIIKKKEHIKQIVDTFQLDVSIEQRLYQVGVLINLLGALLYLREISDEAAKYSKSRGDVVLYTENSNKILFDAFRALSTKIKNFYQDIIPLLEHILILKKRILTPPYSDYINFYTAKVKVIYEIDEGEDSLFCDIRKLSSPPKGSIEEEAKRNEQRLRETLRKMNDTYGLELNATCIDTFGENSDRLIFETKDHYFCHDGDSKANNNNLRTFNNLPPLSIYSPTITTTKEDKYSNNERDYDHDETSIELHSPRPVIKIPKDPVKKLITDIKNGKINVDHLADEIKKYKDKPEFFRSKYIFQLGFIIFSLTNKETVKVIFPHNIFDIIEGIKEEKAFFLNCKQWPNFNLYVRSVDGVLQSWKDCEDMSAQMILRVKDNKYFTIHPKQWPEYYIQITNLFYGRVMCYSPKDPGSAGHFKLTYHDNSYFKISAKAYPNNFIYISSGPLGIVRSQKNNSLNSDNALIRFSIFNSKISRSPNSATKQDYLDKRRCCF